MRIRSAVSRFPQADDNSVAGAVKARISRNITFRLLTAFLLLSIVPLLVDGFLTVMVGKKYLSGIVVNHLRSLAVIQRHRIETSMEQRIEKLAILAGLTPLRENLAAFESGGGEENRAALRELLHDVQSAVNWIDEIELVDARGAVLASTNDAAIGKMRSGEDFFRHFMIGRTRTPAPRPFTAFFFPDTASGDLMVRIAVPVRRGDDVLGVVAASVDANRIVTVATDYTGLGETGETVLFGKAYGSNEFILLPLRAGGEGETAKPITFDELSDPRMRFLMETPHAETDATDWWGRRVLVAGSFIDRYGLGVMVKIDRDEAYAPVERLHLVSLLVAVLTAVLTSAAALYISRSITRPTLRLTEAARRISDGDLATPIEVASRDEIGQLADAFRAMTSRLVEANLTLERKVKARTEALARSNADLSQFAYVASHDLQEPLRMVASYTQLLARRYKGRLDTDADEFIAFAVDGANRMQKLINDLLLYSRVGTRGKEFAPTDSEEVLSVVLSNLELLIEEAGASVTRDPLPVVMADRSQLIQLLQNLVANGIKFRREGEAPRIHVSAGRNGSEWVFSVSDNGIGISREYWERVFVIFKRLHGVGEYPGTGIGLAVCKRIVERHGGRIWISSTPGQGATFYFTMPAVETDEEDGKTGKKEADKAEADKEDGKYVDMELKAMEREQPEIDVQSRHSGAWKAGAGIRWNSSLSRCFLSRTIPAMRGSSGFTSRNRSTLLSMSNGPAVSRQDWNAWPLRGSMSFCWTWTFPTVRVSKHSIGFTSAPRKYP